jgi:hypothetical protein
MRVAECIVIRALAVFQQFEWEVWTEEFEWFEWGSCCEGFG